MPHVTLSRRAWLSSAATATAALLTGGCTPWRASRPTSTRIQTGSQGATPLRLSVAGPFGAASGLLSGFNATHPDVVAATLTPADIQALPLILNTVRQGYFSVSTLEPLDGPLHILNFDPVVLLPGSVEAFTVGGRIYALPTTLSPWCVRWRSDAFEAAGLPTPDPQWTLDAFEAACAALQRVVDAGKVSGLAAVLAPMVGAEYRITDTSNRTIDFLSGSAAMPGLWAGFALGFGGTVIDQGRFVLTDPGTLAGLSRLVDIAGRYGLPAGNVPSQIDGMSRLTDLFAMQFWPFGPGYDWTYDQRWQFARLPVFPVQPVIPALYSGAGAFHPGAGQMPSPDVAARYETAAAEFLTWTYGAEPQSLLAAAGVAPVLADQATQDHFWSVSSPQAHVVGDWRHFVNYARGWPAAANEQTVFGALEQAVRAPATLAAQLAQAEQTMNAAVGIARASGSVARP